MADGKSTPSIGELVAANYQILGTAGAGGMGVVYRALDLKLQRTVALKFLPPDLNASERDKARFLREARTASSLDHPNIGVIYGIEDTADDRSFIAMAFYEGKSLAQRIRSGPLSPLEATDITIQMLKGLEHAHSQGIEHRDVKPSNIMITQQGATSRPVVKIVDFGLAHVSQQTASKTHGISGTVAYMSPEQTLGRPIDSKTDIWAVGIVFMEMLTGQNPFFRESIPGTVFAILNEPPTLPEGVPAELQQVIYRSLSKDPQRRYPNCTEMLRDLEALRDKLPDTPAAANPANPSLETKSARRSKESADLRRSREYASASTWMTPPPKTSSKPWLIALAAIVVLSGVALFVPPVRQKLGSFLVPPDSENRRPRQAAYEGYLAALGYLDRYDKPGNLDRAVDALQGSLKADPLFALGYAELGEAYRMKYQTDRNPEWLDLALSNCQRAEELDNRIPTAYTTLANIHNSQGKHDLAVQEIQQALDINPRDVAAVTAMAHSEEAAGHLPEAEEGFKKAIALRPDDWSGPTDLGSFYTRNGRYKEAADAYKQAVALSPGNAFALNNLAANYLSLGDPQSLRLAEEALKSSLAIQPSYLAYSNLGVIYLEQKRYAESAAMSAKATGMNAEDYLVWDNLRTAYEWLHDQSRADAATAKELPLVEKVVQAKSQDGLSHAVLATLYAKRGETSKAELQIQSALAFAPDSPETLQTVADAYESLGDRQRAKQYLKQAIAKGAAADSIGGDADIQEIANDPDLQTHGRAAAPKD
ncbi:serine/threonine protein kinase [Acidisarcina polymorpha]|uniref:Serine/threonine protein kinase n=1 Tax=Acidisarcina polymorpha TaxID=2211140 RepID=A0A2Z5FYH8_9BACT|nr:serine/threonine-protein kinase [Acidisarcina polymorpha]AXC11465.1 serine/threonine protein kinase [Acidisarcina polymorpha]